MTPNKPVSEILKDAKETIQKGWCQGQLYKLSEKNCEYCSIGAIQKSLPVHISDQDYKDENRPYLKTCGVLYKSVFGKAPRSVSEDYIAVQIANWNDKETTTKAEVLKAFDKAIKIAEDNNIPVAG